MKKYSAVNITNQIMKLKKLILLVLVIMLHGVVPASGQAPHQPVSAGSSQEYTDHSPQADSARYKAAQERDRERIKNALKQSRENLDSVNESKDDLRTKKIYAKVASYAVFGIIALLFYIWKKKKANKENDDIRSV